MTDDRLTTTNAIEYLRDRVQEVPEPAERSWDILVDGGALALALAEFAAARARVAALEAALRDVCAAAVHTDWTMRGTPHYCVVCDAPENDDGDVVHADDCPVAAALALLGDA